MGRKIISTERRQVITQKAHDEVKGKARVRHLYNRFYRKSRFFKSSIFLRLFTLVFCIYIVYLNSMITWSEKEIISNAPVEDVYFIYKTGTKDHKVINLSTTSNNQYQIDFLASKPEAFFKNDTINVLKNIFGKKTFVVKPRSLNINILKKFSRCNNYLIFILGLTLFSFLLFDGYDYLSRVILTAVLIFDVSGILIYLLL